MSIVFKLLQPEFAEGFITGRSIRIGTLFNFRNSEKLAKGISDGKEGLATSHISSTAHLKGYQKALFQQDIKNLGFIQGPNVQIEMESSSITLRHPNCFVFSSCMQMPDLDDFNATIHGEEKYEAVLRINDIAKFSDMLAVALQRNGVSSGKYFGAPVQYTTDDWDYLQFGMKLPSPFEKDRKFIAQNEHRVIFEGVNNTIVPGFADFDPFPMGLVERLF